MSVLLAAAVTSEATRTPIGWWVAAPALVVLGLVLVVAPIWPWTKDWGWTIAGIVGVTVATIAMFTTAWLLS